MKKLLEHFKRGQQIAKAYLEPDIPENEEFKKSIFIDGMIELFDSPAQREAQAHAEFDYLAESARTAAGKYHGELVNMATLLNALAQFQYSAARLDRIKKLLFYGEDHAKGRFADTHTGNERADVALTILGGDEAPEIIHAVLGIASEAGEVAEALHKALYGEIRPDLTNLLEEVGDLQWYEALLARAFNVDFDMIQRANIDKLRDRFPDKFTTEAANNRDLDKERATLEAGLGTSEPDWPKPVRPVSDEHKHVPAASEE